MPSCEQNTKKPSYLSEEQWETLKTLNRMGVGSIAQLKTTNTIVESLASLGLAEPRRRLNPAIPLWQPSRKGDDLIRQLLGRIV